MTPRRRRREPAFTETPATFTSMTGRQTHGWQVGSPLGQDEGLRFSPGHLHPPPRLPRLDDVGRLLGSLTRQGDSAAAAGGRRAIGVHKHLRSWCLSQLLHQVGGPQRVQGWRQDTALG